MLSTLSSYRVYSNDISKSLARIEASSSVARDAKYYDENIGKVTSVDDFLADQRLYTYAMKAYGLEDQVGSKGFIRKVIESDLADTTSFANKLTDTRYRDFAQAFNFKAGDIKPAAQSTGQTESLAEAYSERRVRSSTAAAAKTSYFERTMPTIDSIDELLDDPVLLDVALRAVGVDPATVSKDYVRTIFTQFAGVDENGSGVAALGQLATLFTFRADGTVPPGTPALSATNTDALIYVYNKATDNLSGPGSAARETAYFNEGITKLDSASDLVNNPRLFDYALKANGFDPSIETPAYIYSVLTSDPKDASGVLARLPTKTSAEQARKDLLVSLNAAFGFAENGDVPTAAKFQTKEGIKATEDLYFQRYKDVSDRKDATHLSTFKLTISKAKSLSDLMALDPAFGRDALNVALKAFDIDPASASLTQIRRVLESDASDPGSYVNRLGDERYTKLAAAFNFDSKGALRAERLIQSTSAQSATGALYAATYGAKPSEAQKAVITSETKDYLTKLSDIDSLAGFLKADKVVDYALKAYGLDKEKLTDDQVSKILTSDLADRKSYVYTLDDARYTKFATAFNFTKDGTVRIDAGGVQSDSKKLSTQNLYLLQTLEEQAGESNEGTRLALYFLRKSPDIKSTLSLLADKALYEVVKTALSLPDSFAQLDIDQQVKTIEKKLKVADLQDKGKLDAFVARFAALYDLTNNSGAASPIMGLFGEATGLTGILASL